MEKIKITFRNNPIPEDTLNVKRIVESTGFFYDFEVDVAIELVDERLNKGIESGYLFTFIEVNNEVAGYACYGLIPCTKCSYDLYWIAVDDKFRGKGLGKKIMTDVEKEIAKLGGHNIYIETSSREKYIPTQNFYLNCNCTLEARFKDFYDIDDDKLVYVKRV